MTNKTLFKAELSDELNSYRLLSKKQAETVFEYFKRNKLFRWRDANNDCEDRANAICILLDEWKIQNGKAWVFSGYMFNKTGFLKNLWKYHVAALLPVANGKEISYYVVDPATSKSLIDIKDWAANVTDNPHSYHLVKSGSYYIYNEHRIRKNNWYKRNKGNYNWTMQGLSGINGITSKGKAQLAFNKKRLLRVKRSFKELLNTPSPFD